MVMEPIIGKKVFTLKKGTVISGVITEIYNFDAKTLKPGYSYCHGFKVKWDKVGVTDHQWYEVGLYIFYTRKEVIDDIKSSNPKETTKVFVESAKDYYGLQLKVGDCVEMIDHSGKGGFITRIFVDLNDEYNMHYLEIEDMYGHLVDGKADPRIYTTSKRNSMLRYYSRRKNV